MTQGRENDYTTGRRPGIRDTASHRAVSSLPGALRPGRLPNGGDAPAFSFQERGRILVTEGIEPGRAHGAIEGHGLRMVMLPSEPI